MGASHMTVSHNSLIRGFNSIYQQAPRISASDYKDFVGYCLAWHGCVEEHHYHEEVNYFPEIEKATGQKGVMDGEVEQHGKRKSATKAGAVALTSNAAAFHAGLKSFKDYFATLKNPESDFKPTSLLKIMDSFSEPLYTHLAAEPQALLALSRFASPDKQFDLSK